MVESAMEFLRICEDENYHNIVLSMKASNPKVMVEAYRLLVNHMMEADMNYPLHLGVTEAGEGEDGRIKSAVGIGTLLEDGLGDTVRVSLTEEPEAEIPVAKALVERYSSRKGHAPIPEIKEYPINPFEYSRRETTEIGNIGSGQAPVVIADLSLKKEIKPSTLFPYGYSYSVPLDKWNIQEQAVDYLFLNNHTLDFEIPGQLGVIQNYKTWLSQKHRDRHYPFLTTEEYQGEGEISNTLNFIYTCAADLTDSLLNKINTDKSAVLFLDTYHDHGMAEQRSVFLKLIQNGVKTPVVIGRAYGDLNADQFQLYSATDIGALLVDGLGDGIFLAPENCGPDSLTNRTAFGILQATRTRISKTEYISCPSCGRTLFDLQEVTAKIRSRTEHLKGVKIGIMGCIVNGPGEMADADYGYVGTGPGKISLYKEKEVVKRNVPETEAVDELIELIKSHGDWVDA
jgi:(E)-4-hydroxy-3-methylbut-2-enyl-diphosphate synthase